MAGIGRNMVAPLLVLNLIMYIIVIGFASCACWRPSSSSSPSRSSSTCSCSTRASSAAAVATGTTTTASAARPASPRGSPGSEDSDRCSSYMCHHIRRCWSVMT
ncbi:Plasma membrane associated protein [Zea mays]|uniref:Plasma membrane associated protein n=1 Tax=Zea mays TaxID=4577 RepID=A0A1D6HXY6_MAIZE|nr:Plasma membrane associated protein [Zea mays]